nr:hypothetical protein [Oceanicoccus sagamiensis]
MQLLHQWQILLAGAELIVAMGPMAEVLSTVAYTAAVGVVAGAILVALGGVAAKVMAAVKA